MNAVCQGDQKSGLQDELTTYCLLSQAEGEPGSGCGYITPSTINPSVLQPSTGVSLAVINFTISSAQQKSKTGAKVPGLTSAPSSGYSLQPALL